MSKLSGVIDWLLDAFWSLIWPQSVAARIIVGLFIAVVGGLAVRLMWLIVEELVNKTDFGIDFGFEKEYAGVYVSPNPGGVVGHQTVQEYPRLRLIHRGRRDSARVEDVKVKIYHPYFPFRLRNFSPQCRLIDGSQPFSQGESITIQIDSNDILEEARGVTSRDDIKIRFCVEESISGCTFRTDKYDVDLSRIEERDTEYSN